MVNIRTMWTCLLYCILVNPLQVILVSYYCNYLYNEAPQTVIYKPWIGFFIWWCLVSCLILVGFDSRFQIGFRFSLLVYTVLKWAFIWDCSPHDSNRKSNNEQNPHFLLNFKLTLDCSWSHHFCWKNQS